MAVSTKQVQEWANQLDGSLGATNQWLNAVGDVAGKLGQKFEGYNDTIAAEYKKIENDVKEISNNLKKKRVKLGGQLDNYLKSYDLAERKHRENVAKARADVAKLKDTKK